MGRRFEAAGVKSRDIPIHLPAHLSASRHPTVKFHYQISFLLFYRFNRFVIDGIGCTKQINTDGKSMGNNGITQINTQISFYSV